MGRSLTVAPAVQEALQAATISEDGLTLTLAGQLDRAIYQATAKAIEVLGGKWNRKAKAHLFSSDVRTILAGVLDGDRLQLPKKNPLAFFATPEPLVQLLLNILGDVRSVRVMEPSAGDGAIADELLNAGALVDVLELDDTRHGHLIAAGYQPVGRDFLAYTPTEPYPVIVMNPPFTAEGDVQAYITHIEHAWTTCLAPGGHLVAIAPSGFTFRQDKRATAFRALAEQHGEWADNDENAFRESGTSVQTVTLYLRKPAQEAVMPAAIEQPAKSQRKSSKKAAAVEPVEQAQMVSEFFQEVPAPAFELPTSEPPTLESHDVTPILVSSTSGMFRVDQLVASPLNPRKVFEQSAIEELAESILHKGLMQNLVGRVADNGQDVEIVAGGRRLRALKLLAEQGRIPADHPVPVRVQPLTDLEALQLATAENVERRNMTALEEADAFAQMVALGAKPEDIALRFGYSGRTVAQRLTLAEGLGEDGRKLFEDGQIGLGQAQVIAQTTGPLRKHVLTEAGRGGGVQALTNLIKRGSFLVEHARFDVPTSGLEIVEDLYHSEPARFADPKAALARQLDWVKARAAELEGKKEQHFVEVRKTDGPYLSLPYSEFTTYDAPKELFGTVIMVNTVTGEVKESRAARESDVKSYRARKQAEERKQTSAEATGSEGGTIRKSGWVDGHEVRATALRNALVGDHKRTVALTILSMLGAEPISLHTGFHHVHTVPIPTGLQRLRELDAKLGGILRVPDTAEPKNPVDITFGYSSEGEAAYQFLQTLLTLTLEELLDIQSVLIAQAVGGWCAYNPMHVAYPFVTRLTADVGATTAFKLTDDQLKAYPRDRLLELAADAGLTHSHGLEGDLSKLVTNKDIRAAILEYADALTERGYVPPIARFPELAPLAAVPTETATN